MKFIQAYIEIEFDDTKANERDIGSIDFFDSKLKKLNKDGIKTYGIYRFVKCESIKISFDFENIIVGFTCFLYCGQL